MLYLTYKDSKNVYTIRKWHIGEEKPQVALFGSSYDLIEVQADEDEMYWILERCVNLPHISNSKTQTWFGSMAKFIVKNL